MLTARVAELEAKLGVPPKTSDNSSVPPSKGHKPNQAKKAKRSGPRQGSLGRTGGGRALAAHPDEVVTARPVRCAHCQAALGEDDQMLHGRCALLMQIHGVLRWLQYSGSDAGCPLVAS